AGLATGLATGLAATEATRPAAGLCAVMAAAVAAGGDLQRGIAVGAGCIAAATAAAGGQEHRSDQRSQGVRPRPPEGRKRGNGISRRSAQRRLPGIASASRYRPAGPPVEPASS